MRLALDKLEVVSFPTSNALTQYTAASTSDTLNLSCYAGCPGTGRSDCGSCQTQ
jgi:hypothetical protein